jgi:hypothetical protein
VQYSQIVEEIMKKFINVLKMFRYFGKIESEEILSAVIFGFVLSISTMFTIFDRSTSGAFWIAVIAFVFIRASFGRRDSLATNMACSVKKKVTYSYVFYGAVVVLLYIVFQIRNTLLFLGMISLGNGEIYDVFIWNYQNVANYFYDGLLLMGTFYLFFPACFMGKSSLKWLWMLMAAVVRILYGRYTYSAFMKYGDKNVQMLEGFKDGSIYKYGFMEMAPNAKVHILLLTIFVFIIMTISWYISIKVLSNTKSFGDNEDTLLKIKKHKTKIIACIVGVVVLLVVALAIFIALVVQEASKKPKYETVAHAITEDGCYGPIVFDEEVYFPVDEDEMFPDEDNSEAIGYFGFGEGEVSAIDVILAENLVYVDTKDENHTYVKIRGFNHRDYIKASVSESKELSTYNCYIIWDEDWLHQTAFNLKGQDGYYEVSKDLIDSLEERYGVVEYKEEDFREYDAYYTVAAFKDRKEALESLVIEVPHVIGCILKSKDNYYYGNKNNILSGDLLEKIKLVLE